MNDNNAYFTTFQRQKARGRLRNKGVSRRELAEKLGVDIRTVHSVLDSPRERCIRGNSYRIAVALGLRPADKFPLPKNLPPARGAATN